MILVIMAGFGFVGTWVFGNVAYYAAPLSRLLLAVISEMGKFLKWGNQCMQKWGKFSAVTK